MPLLPRGLGRSYGDACLNQNGYLLSSKGLSHIHGFDVDSGVIRCEAGVTLEEILRLCVPRGWFLPVTPGTKFVTVGGAVAHDVHGKNHHQAGSFGNHVLQFELLRSDGSRLLCSPESHPQWFHATIGGLGLTGLITWVEFQLKPISGPYIEAETIKFGDLCEFAALCRSSASDHEYTVAWIDSLATGRHLGRGLFMRGNHSPREEPDPEKAVHRQRRWKAVPFDLPPWVLSRHSVGAFNRWYYHRQPEKRRTTIVHYDPFFYPLDGIANWNRLYGRRGFLQWQCLVPFASGYECLAEVLDEITSSKLASFLTVLKEFGDVQPVGLLSFPMPGISLAIDFPNLGSRLFQLLDRLDARVCEHGGRIYPAKDARMAAETFHRGFSRLSEFAGYVDPKLSSSFYRRVGPVRGGGERFPATGISPRVSQIGTHTMSLLSLAKAVDLNPAETKTLYQRHVNPGLLKAYSILGFANLDIDHAEGVEIRLRDGRTLLDFSSAIGVLGLGHNHPRILAAERLCHERKLIDAFKVGPLKLQAALAHNLAQMLPDALQVSFFTTSGAEAVEAAMKLCEKAQGPRRTKFLTTTHAYHGKTHGALSLTRTEGFADGFLLGIPPQHVVEVAYGDIAALRRAIEDHSPSGEESAIIAVVLEPIQGQGIVEAPPGYLKEVADLCRAKGILVIFDEVKVGMGRTGTFCAFEQDGVVPDVVTLSKALGGGKRAIGAMVTSADLFRRAYGKRKDWGSHTTTFGGLGQSCAVAIETLNIYQEERLVEQARQKGEYLTRRLLELQTQHPTRIREVRGRGLFQGVRFNFNGLGKAIAGALADVSESKMFKTLDAVIMAGVIRELCTRHHIVTHFSASHPDVLHIMPPLVVEEPHLDRLVEALDAVLSKGMLRLMAGLGRSA